ncbi:MAG: segregation/condensation protein A [Clostridia bacterium]|nr:segregation/condensation protein A [Clostridia bacterium]
MSIEKIAEKFESVVDYNTTLANFDGPLDLLLYLVKQAEIRIEDIFVSDVTAQYLKYIESVNELDVEKASEYLTMAATLLEIKSKALLPQVVTDDGDDDMDPEKLLLRRLEEYRLFKEEADALKAREIIGRYYKAPDDSANDVRIVYTDFNLEGLIKAFVSVMTKADLRESARAVKREIPKEVFTVKDKIDFIRQTLLDRQECSFYELFSPYYTRNELITTFQAMLELLKMQYIFCVQTAVYDDITIKLNPDRSEEIGEIDEYN